MRQQTLQTYSNSTCQWLRVSGGVCWRLLSSVFFSNLTLLRHQNIKMSIYKVDKNHWVMWLFCFLVPVRKILKNTVALDHPVALSSNVCRSFVVRSSRIHDTSSYLHYMMFQTIQTIYFLWGYDPGNMSVSFIAELSPVYCCLVCNIKGAVHIFRTVGWTKIPKSFQNLMASWYILYQHGYRPFLQKKWFFLHFPGLATMLKKMARAQGKMR